MGDIEFLDYENYKKKKKKNQTDVFLDQVSESREWKKWGTETLQPLSDKVNEMIDGGVWVMKKNPYELTVLNNSTAQVPQTNELHLGHSKRKEV